jgi:hypothetical protein
VIGIGDLGLGLRVREQGIRLLILSELCVEKGAGDT